MPEINEPTGPSVSPDAPRPRFSALDWELTVAGSASVDREVEPTQMLAIAAVLAAMADENGYVDVDPAAYPAGSDEQYMAALLMLMALEDGQDPSMGWRLRMPSSEQ